MQLVFDLREAPAAYDPSLAMAEHVINVILLAAEIACLVCAGKGEFHDVLVVF